MKIDNNLYEYWIHKYAYNSSRKRRQFNRLRKLGKVWYHRESGYKQAHHYVYRSNESIKLVRG